MRRAVRSTVGTTARCEGHQQWRAALCAHLQDVPGPVIVDRLHLAQGLAACVDRGQTQQIGVVELVVGQGGQGRARSPETLTPEGIGGLLVRHAGQAHPRSRP